MHLVVDKNGRTQHAQTSHVLDGTAPDVWCLGDQLSFSCVVMCGAFAVQVLRRPPGLVGA